MALSADDWSGRVATQDLTEFLDLALNGVRSLNRLQHTVFFGKSASDRGHFSTCSGTAMNHRNAERCRAVSPEIHHG